MSYSVKELFYLQGAGANTKLSWLVPSSALTRCGESLGQTPRHRISARCDQAASWGGRGACEGAGELPSQHRGERSDAPPYSTALLCSISRLTCPTTQAVPRTE